MGHGDHQVGWRCWKPTRLQLSLEDAMLHIESIDTLYSASCLPLRGQSRRQRLAGELPENLSTKNPSLDVEVAGVQPHGARHSQLASSSGHFEWSVVAPG
jgi:hypothetical protein